MIRFIFDLGVRLTTFVALAAAFFRKPGRGCGLATEFGLGRGDSPANSLPDAVAEEMFSLPAERAKSQHQLNELLDVIVAKGQHQHTRDQILDFLWPQYKEYRLERKKREQVGVAQAAMKK